MQITRIKRIESLGVQNTLDFEVDHPDHNFYAEGLVSSNSHSVAYSTLAIQCAYYKWKYPALFFTEYLKIAKFASNSDGGPQGEVAKIINELEIFGIKIKHPDILESSMDFTVDDSGTILYALTSIKGIAEKKIAALHDFRGEYPNKFDMFQAAKTSGLNIGDLSALIQAGAMSSIIGDRCFAVFEAQVWNVLTDREKRFMMLFGEQFNYKVFDVIKHVVKNEIAEEGGKKRIIADTRYETIKRHSEKYLQIWNLNKRYHELASWYFERKLLGYSYTGSLYEIMGEDVKNLMDMSDFKYEADDTICNYAGIVTELFNRPSKKGKNMLRLMLADSSASITAIMYDKAFDSWVAKNLDEKGKPKLPKKDSIVVISGSKRGDAVFINKLHIMDEKIYLKLSELKNFSKSGVEKIEVGKPEPKKEEDTIYSGEAAFLIACKKANIEYTATEIIYEGHILLKGKSYTISIIPKSKADPEAISSDNIDINEADLSRDSKMVAIEKQKDFLLVLKDDLVGIFNSKAGPGTSITVSSKEIEETVGNKRKVILK